MDAVNIFGRAAENLVGWTRHLLPWMARCRLYPGGHMGLFAILRLIVQASRIMRRAGARRLAEGKVT